MRPASALGLVFASLLPVTQCGGPATPPSSGPPAIAAPTAPSPVQTYTLSGTVKEAWIDTGLPGATVMVDSGPSRGVTTTDVNGRFTLTGLLPGVYTLTVSKAAPYGSTTYAPVNVFADATFTGALSLTGGFPVTASNLQGYWVAQGPYPNQPAWILLLQDGTRLGGWYKDSRDYSTAMSGTYVDDAIRLDVGTAGLSIEGHVEDARCIRAFIKNEALGGNFPVTISRGGSCGR